jgi:Protein of unknown function (DUF3455)
LRLDSKIQIIFAPTLNPKLSVARIHQWDVSCPHVLSTTQGIIMKVFLTIATLGLTACASLQPAAPFNQNTLPAAVQTPAGHQLAFETVGKGMITYRCSEKKDAAGQFEWVFVGPDAVLTSRDGKMFGKYFGPPATWESTDGSKATGAQVAVSPSGAGNIPLQLVKANRATGLGVITDVSYIQRVATVGGVAPTSACGSYQHGERQVVGYQADYIFYKPQ